MKRGLKIGVYEIVINWMLLKVVVYVMIIVGGFVRKWGIDN